MNTSRYYFARSGVLAILALIILATLLLSGQWLATATLIAGWELGYLYHDYARRGVVRKRGETPNG